MKDTNNKITEEDFTKGESIRVEIPVEKTVEELFAEFARISTFRKSEKKRNLQQQIISEVKQQVRREVVEELLELKETIFEDMIGEYEVVTVGSIKEYSLLKGKTLKN